MNIQKLKSRLTRLILRMYLPNILCFGYKSDIPQRQILAGYMIYALVGAFLLTFPFAQDGTVSFVDNLFNSVSALSTTGLTTVDVSAHYSTLGHVILLCLIQIGGIGYMTISSFIMLGITHHLGSRRDKMLSSLIAVPSGFHRLSVVRNIVRFTFLFEALGVILLYPYFLLHGIDNPLWSAIFHSISAFCTAGFSIYSDNLMQFQANTYVCLVILMLSYMGAMGFIMMTDVMQKIRDPHHRISFTTRIIVRITLIFTIISTLHLYYCEPSLQHFRWDYRLLAAFFHGVSAMTTAGFNTVDLSSMVPISMFVMTVTMYIGASPSGTGGGLKSTTISALYAFTINKLKLKPTVTLNGNTIPPYRIETACTTLIFYSFILLCGIYLITLLEPNDTDVLKISFEASSALATTGLSCGLINDICTGSKLVIIALMFIGRVGVITLGNALLLRSHHHTPSQSDLAI